MPTTTIEEAAITSTTALVMGHGGGSDCLVASLVADWLHRIGVPRTILGGIACQWWMPVGEQRTWLNTTVGPDFYDPTQLTAVTQIGESCVIVTAESALDGRQPHEAIAARHFGGESFLISLRQGGVGVAAGMRAAVEHFGADLLISVDVGSDTLSTGREIRPTQTSLADHLTLAGLLQQDCRTYFALAGYGVDAEMELEELDHNLSVAIKAQALRGVIAPSYAAIERVDRLHGEAHDPVGSLVIKAGRGEFGLHRTLKSNPFVSCEPMTQSSFPRDRASADPRALHCCCRELLCCRLPGVDNGGRHVDHPTPPMSSSTGCPVVTPAAPLADRRVSGSVVFGRGFLGHTLALLVRASRLVP